MADEASGTSSRRVQSWIGFCVGAALALSMMACRVASEPTEQITPPAAGSSSAGAGAAIPAADSGGRPAAPVMPASTSGAGTSGMLGSAAAAGVAAPAVHGGAGTAAVAAGAPAAIAGTGGTAGMPSAAFILTPIDFPMAGAELTFPQTANPPTNQSPEFTWTGVPPQARTLALAFRDLGNSAVKWIIWDMPPSLTHLPPNIMPVAMPSEVPGSSQLGSLDNQGYAGPGMGARQYDFVLWALDTDKLPVTPRMTTVQIHELLEKHEVEKTPPVLVRNTRNL